jgi:hypothetical protein
MVDLWRDEAGTVAVQAFLDEVRARGVALVWERSWTCVYPNTGWAAA